MQSLQSLSVTKLKNIIIAHNAMEKINVIKKYGSMKKAELIKAIQDNVKEENLLKILNPLLSSEKKPASSEKKPATMNFSDEMKKRAEAFKLLSKNLNDAFDDIAAKKQTDNVEDFIKMMEMAGEKAAKRTKNLNKLDEKQSEMIYEFIKMMEIGGEKTAKKIKQLTKKPENNPYDVLGIKQNSNAYEILGVPMTATEQEIKKAYNKKALVYHPDKKPGFENVFLVISNAYRILSDSATRRALDIMLMGRRSR